MTQSTDIQLSDQGGAGFRTELNSILSAFGSSHRGSSRPTYATAGMHWVNNSGDPEILYYYDGADDIEVASYFISLNVIKLTNQGDGTTLQGIPTIKQIQNGSVIYAATTGSSNAYILSVAPAPTAYVAGQGFRIKPNFSNTGAVTIDVNGLGAKSIVDGSGNALTANALTNGNVQEIFYNGAAFNLSGGSGSAGVKVSSNDATGGVLNGKLVAGTGITFTENNDGSAETLTISTTALTSAGQGDLRSSTGTFSDSAGSGEGGGSTSPKFSTLAITMPGGQYGFWPETGEGSGSSGAGWWTGATGGASYAAKARAYVAGAGFATALGRQRYITSSPPFDSFNEGEIAGFCYMVIQEGKVIATYLADVPPWAYNGPTRTRADYVCKSTGKKYRKKALSVIDQIKQKKSALDIKPRGLFFDDLDKEVNNELLKARNMLGSKEFEKEKYKLIAQNVKKCQTKILDKDYELITEEIKNRDMVEIPHPFGELPPGAEVIMIGAYDPVLRQLIDAQNDGEDLLTEFVKGNFFPDTEEVRAGCSRGVKHVRLRIK